MREEASEGAGAHLEDSPPDDFPRTGHVETYVLATKPVLAVKPRGTEAALGAAPVKTTVDVHGDILPRERNG